jgi:hypothetical protein
MMDRIFELNRCRQWIVDALEYSKGTHTFDDIATGVMTQRYQLWPGNESAVVTEVIVYPQFKNLHFFLAGGNLDELKQMRPHIETWGKSVGCTRVTLAGRKGWERTFLKDEGYEPQWFILSKELQDESNIQR